MLPDKWRRLVHGSTSQMLDTSHLRMPATIDAESRPYEIDGAAWLHHTKRGILADDAGLGKTVQAMMAAERPIMVTCPSYLANQWEEVIKQEYPNDSVSNAAFGNRMQRHRALTGSTKLSTLVGPSVFDWTIVSNDMHRGYYLPDATTWIIDEAHHFRNQEAERTKEAYNYAERVERIYALTATPVYKDVTNLWSLLHMMDPKKYSSYWRFFQEYAKTTGDTGWGSQKVIGIWNPKKLERELEDYMLRRTYKDAGLFLPDMIEKDIVVEFDPATRKLYKDVKDNYVYEDIPLTSQGAVLHTLRRVTVNTKIDAVQRIIEDNPAQPTLVYSWYQDSAEDCALAIDGTYISGATHSPEDRKQAALDSIAQGKPVVATIASMAEGVDLSMCKQLIYIEEDYVPGSMYQSERRTKRWSEDERPILAYYVRVAKTVDGDVHHAVTSRRGSASTVLRDALT